MAAIRLPRGLIIDLITPLAREGKIDGRGLGKHIDRVLPYIQALFISSPYMGEGMSLGLDQREELFDKALVIVQGKVPILMWISEETDKRTKETLVLLKKRISLRKYTGPVFWVDTPLYYHSNRGLPGHYEDMSSLAEEPFILHNDPDLIRRLHKSFKRNNIRTSILKELALLKSIKGLIFSGSLDRAYNYQKAVRARTDFRIYDGDESRFLEHPSLNGIISGGANLAPRAWQKITASSLNLDSRDGDYPDYLKQIWDTGRYLNNLKGIYHKYGTPLIKNLLSEMGLMEKVFSIEMQEDIKEEIKAIKELMKQHGDFL
jgi:dihydrodipicolinate synthase/N-acetylneuraminate lyase